MNISLSQKEIEAAVKAYVTGQGIAFNGKALTSIEFVTTRNPFTVTARLVLEDANVAADTEIPGFTDRPAADPTLSLAVNNSAAVNGETGKTLLSAPPAEATTETKTVTDVDPVPGTIGAAIAGVIETTENLLASPANAAHLDKSLEQAKNGEAKETQLIEESKSVPEEAAQAAEASVADPAPAAAETPAAAPAPSTTSLFG